MIPRWRSFFTKGVSQLLKLARNDRSMSIHFRLFTPDHVLIDEEVQSISLPTPDGEITVLPRHADLVSLLSPGVIKVYRSSQLEEVATSGGFIQIEHDQVHVLADTAEQGHELNLSVIERAKQRAKDLMTKTVHADDVSFAMAAAALEKELARYRVAMKHRDSRRGVPTIDQPNLPHDENPV